MNDDYETISLRLSGVFQPSAPIEQDELFFGRMAEVRRVVDAINQRGMHAVIYGEAGVGKTSLGKILQQKIKAVSLYPIRSPLVTCVSTDNYESIWARAFEELDELNGKEPAAEEYPLLPQPIISPNSVRRRLDKEAESILYVIFDEFNKIEDEESRRLFADTIKLLSDRACKATIIVIGVADDVLGLIDDHSSIQRCLAQIPMPRMPRAELQEIVVSGFRKVGMHVEEEVTSEIAFLSKGLPHYTHLLSLLSGRAATDSGTMTVSKVHLDLAVKLGIRQAQESIRTEYHEATASTRHNIYAEVLLACAMASTDDFGRFAPMDVQSHLARVLMKSVKLGHYNSHLKRFCEADRGCVLDKAGGEYRWKYRFSNPLMQPFVLLSGLESGRITEDDLKQYTDAKGQRYFWEP